MNKIENTNKRLAEKMKCTPRQIAKSRKRGYITNSSGLKVKFTAPPPVHIP